MSTQIRNFSRRLFVFLALVGLFFGLGLSPSFAKPPSFPDELTASMLSPQDVKTLSDGGVSVEEFVRRWSPWYRACMRVADSQVFVQNLTCYNEKINTVMPGHNGEFPAVGLDVAGLVSHMVSEQVRPFIAGGTSTLDADIAGYVAKVNAQANGAGVLGGLAAGAGGWLAGLAGVNAGMVDAVSNPTGQVDKMVNRLKTDSVGAMDKGLSYVTHTLSFDANATWFRQTYAAAAGVGLFLLAYTLIAAVMRASSGRLPASEAFGAVGASLAYGIIGLTFTPVFAYVLSGLSDALSEGVASWIGSNPDAIASSLLNPGLALTTDNSPLGWFGAVLIYVLFFLAALSLLITFAAQLVATYLGAVGLGVMWGMVMTPRGRKNVARACIYVACLIFTKPLILFFVGAVMRLSNAYAASNDGWSTDPMGTFMRVLVCLVAVMMVATSPAALAKFVPISSSFDFGSRFSGGFTGGFVGAGVGAAAFGRRLRSLAPRPASRSPRLGAGAGVGGLGDSSFASAPDVVGGAPVSASSGGASGMSVPPKRRTGSSADGLPKRRTGSSRTGFPVRLNGRARSRALDAAYATRPGSPVGGPSTPSTPGAPSAPAVPRGGDMLRGVARSAPGVARGATRVAGGALGVGAAVAGTAISAAATATRVVSYPIVEAARAASHHK